MNYGKTVIKIYNEKFIELKSDFKKYLNKNLDSDKSFVHLFDNYLKKIQKLQKEEYSKDNLLLVCWDKEFYFRYSSYTKNAVINIIENEIFENFNDNLKSIDSRIKDYKTFSETLAKLSIYKDFEKKIKDDSEKIKNCFETAHISAILEVDRQKDQEYLVHYFNVNKNRELQKSYKNKSLAIISKKIPKENLNPLNTLSDDHKLILLNALTSCFKDKDFEISDVEVLSILKITSSALINLPLGKDYGTEYKKFSKGIDYSKKTDRSKKVELTVLREECLKYELIEISKYLSKEMRKL